MGRTLILCFVLLLVASAVSIAEMPETISYHGVLKNTDGSVVPDGPYQLTFRLYDVDTGGSALWTEVQTLPVRGGIFNATLGSVTPIDLAFEVPYWMGVSVEAEPELEPRLELTSSPYAFRSAVAESLVGMEGFVDTTHLHDGRYHRKPILTTPGTINLPGNPVDWTKLKGVPGGFADGTDDVGGSGDGHSLDASDGSPEDVVYVDTEGNVGVGTATPGEALDVVGTAQVTGFRMPTGAADTHVLTSDGSGVGTWQEPAVIPDDDWTVLGDDIVRRTGYVGIGPSEDPPSAQLHVEGDVLFTDPDADGVSSAVKLSVGGSELRYSSSLVGSYTTLDAPLWLNINAGLSLNIKASSISFQSVFDDTTWAAFSSSDRLGVGTAAPYGKLDVRDKSGDWGYPYFLAQLKAASATATLDRLLLISMPEGSSDGSNFLACSRVEGGTEYYKFRVHGDGSVSSPALFAGGGDFAEMMVAGDGPRSVEPGDVLVIDVASPGGVAQSREPRSTLVAGVYSAKPGLVGSHATGRTASVAETENHHDLEYMASEYGEIPLTMVGVVRCKVSAENGPIRIGDLLVTSGTPGHAMRDPDPRPGTILGKALASLDSGTGVIKVLVTPN